MSPSSADQCSAVIDLNREVREGEEGNENVAWAEKSILRLTINQPIRNRCHAYRKSVA